MFGFRSKKTNSRKSSSSKHSTRDDAFQVLRDMVSDPSLDLTQAARNRNVDPRTVKKHFGTALQKDSSGHFRVRPDDDLRTTLYIPSDKPGVEIPIRTSNSYERRLLGRWMAALNSAGRGDFSKMHDFPPGQSIGGVTLPTSDYEIQRILTAMAEAEEPFEGLYRTIARQS